MSPSTKQDQDEFDKLIDSNISPDEQSAMEREAYNGAAEDMAERQGLDKKTSDEDSAESEDSVPFTGKDAPKKSFRARWQALSFRKRAGAAGAAVVVTGSVGLGAFGMYTALPGFLAAQLQDTVLNAVNKLQNSQQREYRRRNVHKLKDRFTLEGNRAGKLMADMENHGYIPRFSSSGELTGLELPNGNVIEGAEAIGAHASDYMEIRHPLRLSRWKTKQMNAFYSHYKIKRSSIVSGLETDGDTPRDAEVAVNKEMRENIKEGTGDTTASPRGADEGETEEDTTSRENNNNNPDQNDIANGDNSVDSIEAALDEGTPINEMESIDQKLVESTNTVDDELINILDDIEVDTGNLAGKTFNTVKAFGTSTDIGDKICTLKNRLRKVEQAIRLVRQLGGLRNVALFGGIGDAVKTGKVEPKFMNILMKRITAYDSNNQPIGASPGFAYLMKGKFNKNRNDAFKGSFGVDGKLSGVIGAIDDGLDGVPLTNRQTCRALQNPFFQAGVMAVEIGLFVVTGSGSGVASTLTKEGIKQAVTLSVKRVVSRQAIVGLAKSLTVDIGFEAMLALTSVYLERNISSSFTGQEKGAELGNLLAMGSGSINKQRNLQAGMVPATVDQMAAANEKYIAQMNEERSKKSIASRLFDMNDPESLAYTTSMSLAFSPLASGDLGATSKYIGSGFSGIIQNPMKLFSGAFSALSPMVSAQSEEEIEFDELTVGDQTYATDPAGNIKTILREDIANIDPDENIPSLIASGDIDPDTLEPKSQAFTDHIENCVVDADTINQLENDTHDCKAAKPETQQFKAHMAYLDMADGVDAYTSPEEIDSGGTSGGSSGEAISPTEGLTWPLIQTKAVADSANGGCIRSSDQTVCHAGHPYLAHDLFAEPGTPVVAVASGQVIRASTGGCGHGFGSAFSVQIFNSTTNTTYFYQHMNASSPGVAEGATVNPGDRIGVVGETGAACNTSPHVHIDAVTGRGRPPCSRLSCSEANQRRFMNISSALYKGYEVLQ